MPDHCMPAKFFLTGNPLPLKKYIYIYFKFYLLKKKKTL